MSEFCTSVCLHCKWCTRCWLNVLFEDELNFWSQSIVLQRSNHSTSMIYLKEVFCLGGLEIAISVINLHFNYLELLSCFEVNQDTSPDTIYPYQPFFHWGLHHIYKLQNTPGLWGHHSCVFTYRGILPLIPTKRVKVINIPNHNLTLVYQPIFFIIWRYAVKKNQ